MDKEKVTSIRTLMLIRGRLERTETNLINVNGTVLPDFAIS